jgi:hypothetical protein
MNLKFVSDSVTRPDNATAYAANDVIAGDTAACLQFSGLPFFEDGGVLIKSAFLFSSAAQSTKLEADLLLFSEEITDLDDDNAAFTPTDAQLLNLIGKVSFLAANTIAGDGTSGAGGNAVCAVHGLDIPVNANVDKVYGVLVARNTYTPVSTEVLTVKLGALRDSGEI